MKVQGGFDNKINMNSQAVSDILTERRRQKELGFDDTRNDWIAYAIAYLG